MRWARIELDGAAVYGIVEGDEIETVAGDPFDGYERTGTKLSLDAVKLLVPVVPKTFYAAGLNYLGHVKEQAALHGTKPNIAERPEIGYRANNALIAHGEAIVIPADATDKVEYEGEIVAVIGKQAKHVSVADALDCVLGYTVGNDVSERNWQKSDRTMWRSKNTDTFKPMGPWIETDVDLDALETTVRLNGEEMIRFKTNQMLFGIEAYISAMSQYITLQAGDVIWMGTEGAARNLEDGDFVEVEIDGIGVLSNPVVREG